MLQILEDRFSLYDNFELINNDVLKVDLKNIIKKEKETIQNKKCKNSSKFTILHNNTNNNETY